jgi:gamma-glutamyl hydrolase
MTSLKPHTFLILAIVSLCISHITCEVLNKPVIGIVSTPSDLKELYDPEEYSYIKGSYAEFIEAAGGVPIAIPWDLPESELTNVLNSINGVLFTGGDASLWELDENTNDLAFTSFVKRAMFIIRYAISLNDKGIHYPVYGICQGHEVITMTIAETLHVIDHFRHPGQLDTVEITLEGQKSRMFRNMPDHLGEFIKDRRSQFYNHRYGFNMSLLADNELLNNFFTITAKGADDHGKEFVGAMEAKNYPIYTVQYHPERVLSEWNNKTHFDHPDEAAQAILVHAQFFLSEAIKNDQKFSSQETMEKFMLRNHEDVYINATWPKTYFYDKKSPISYHINLDWSDYSDKDSYDCNHHDCSFISTDVFSLF